MSPLSNRARQPRDDTRRSLPQIGMCFRYNLAIFDQQTSPCDHASVIEVIVAHDFERRCVAPARSLVKGFLGLNVGMELFLLVFQSHRQIGSPSRSPEKIEVISRPLALVKLGYRAEKAILSFEPNRRILNCGRLTRRRGAGEFAAFASGLGRLIRV